MWFRNKKEKIEMLQQLQFTSKASLKKQCLFITNGNVKETKELYEFLVEDMPNLPDTDPIPPTWQENTKDTIKGIMAWLQQNQGTLAQGISYVRGLFAKNAAVVAEEVAEGVTPLPPIN